MPRRTHCIHPVAPATEATHKWHTLDTLVWNLWNDDLEKDRLTAAAVKETSRGIPLPPKLVDRGQDDSSLNSNTGTCSPAWHEAWSNLLCRDPVPQKSAANSTSRPRPASADARFMSAPRYSVCAVPRRPHSAGSVVPRRPKSIGRLGSSRRVQSAVQNPGLESMAGQAAFACRDVGVCDFWAQQQLDQQEMARFRQDLIKQISADNRMKAQQYRARVLAPSSAAEKETEHAGLDVSEASQPTSQKRLQCLSATIPASARLKMLDRLREKHQAKQIEEMSRSGANQRQVSS